MIYCTNEDGLPGRLVHLLPPALASSDARRKLSILFCNLPQLFYRSFGFETRLASRTTDLDAAFCINRELARSLGSDQFAQADNEWWRGILRIADEWQSGSEFSGRVKDLWIEYDLVRFDTDTLLPKLFSGLVQDNSNPENDFCFFKTLISIMKRNVAFSDDIVKEVLDHLPFHDGRMIHIGLSPYHDGIRLCLVFPSYMHLSRFIDDLGLHDSLAIIPECLYRSLDSRRLHLDISENVSTKIGVECYLSEDAFVLANQPLWRPALNELTDRGFCLEEKRDALLNWPGWSYEFIPGKEQFITYRLLYYLKAVLCPGKLPEIKGYFGFVNREATAS